MSGSVLDFPVSISKQDATLKEVLESIEVLADVTFSYQSDVIDQKMIVTISVQNILLRDVLNQILPTTSVGYYALGTQIILFKKNKILQRIAINETSSAVKQQTIYDTLMVVDTVRVFDTSMIVHYDTLMVYDTVIVPKTIDLARTDKTLNYSLELQYAYNYGLQTNRNISSVNITGEEGDMQYHEAMLLWGVHKKNIALKTGIAYSRFLHNITYSNYTISTTQSIETARYYESSIDSIWLVISGVDTVWIEQEDSVLKIDTKKVSIQDTAIKQYKAKNNFRYITIPIYFSGYKQLNKKLSVGLSVGISSYILLQTSGYHIENIDEVKENTKTTVSSVFLMGNIEGQVRYELHPNIWLALSSRFSTHITSMSNLDNITPLWIGMQLSVSKYF